MPDSLRELKLEGKFFELVCRAYIARMFMTSAEYRKAAKELIDYARTYDGPAL